MFVAHTVDNGAETVRHCTIFYGCIHKPIAGDTGSKLVCKGTGFGSAGNIGCLATCPVSDRFVDQGATVLDTCRGNEWEKKSTSFGSGVNAGDLHDVDNQYVWAGTCSSAPSKRCQPTAGAEAACKAQSPAVTWSGGCEQCVGGEGTCTIMAPGITTAWDWLDQLNGSGYAGHSDWRLPTSGENLPALAPSGQSPELESLSDPRFVGPGIHPVFQPSSSAYLSATQEPGDPSLAFFLTVSYGDPGNVSSTSKSQPLYVRAVR